MAVKGAILGDILGSPYEFKRVRIRVPVTVNCSFITRYYDKLIVSDTFVDIDHNVIQYLLEIHWQKGMIRCTKY